MSAILVTQLEQSQIDEILQYVPAYSDSNFDSIRKKCLAKIHSGNIINITDNNNNSYHKRLNKKWIIVLVALLTIAGMTTVYASEISDFIKNFLNKVGIYSSVADSPAYYLESPVMLDNGGELRKAFFAGDTLELVLFLPDDKKPSELLVKTDTAEREPDGFSKGQEGMEFGFYHIEPCGKFELTIDGNQYMITLTSGKSVVSNGDIIPAEANSIDWVNIGYKRTENGIQIFTSFTDEELQLRVIGEPLSMEVKAAFTNKDERVYNNKTSPSPKPLLGYGKENSIYEYSYDPNDTGRPLTLFYSEAPADQEIEVRIPAIVVGYDRKYDNINIEIPMIGEKKVINKEIDLDLQKIMLQSIVRTSATTAELKFALNTGDQGIVSVRDANISCKDVQSGELLWRNNVCTMTLTFNENLKATELSVGWPTYIVNGDWVLIVK